mmetsp:Transcript_42450/g.107131  ORF Transcript_42450/g.107131 Transcript_42450/m.107131 type:complete len:574 (+) Transcript_42450:64-1785(+)|eukprot:CAMPEP_0174242202 /NCGR_PEP_ID=MMETSP0417-20130205/26798_1 /TAXON_ID=242541 /ORGANISM="Mayorella sp, Strain BSH-02190019" /LENGTH=573 /DNA_ID=CAMNT_0015321565 /DNA_START=39 /DNA_END=1760 /DNA_ORIENTATION=+
MYGRYVCVLLAALLLVMSHAPTPTEASLNGGVPCVVCTMLAQMVRVKLESENSTVVETLQEICRVTPAPVQPVCRQFVDKNGAAIEKAFLDYVSPDLICQSLGKCTNPGVCQLFPSVKPTKDVPLSRNELDLSMFFGHPADALLNVAELSSKNIVNWIVTRFGTDHLPLDDLDNDYFSPLWEPLRGRSWRGRDCNDFDHLVYPGTKPSNGDKEFDSNCNGIVGIDSTTKKSYEELYCSPFDQRGVAILGDSVGAHFAFPATWYFPAPGVYDNSLYVLANEVDFPYASWITGYRNDTTGQLDPYEGLIHPLSSVYMKLVERNRCNHRDFQNLAVNGADSGLSVNNLHALGRHQDRDQPMLFFHALIGDDICDHRSVEGWTPVNKFYQSVMTNLEYLNTTLPAGSAVVFIGIIDGRVIWDTLHTKDYPWTGQQPGGKFLGTNYPDFWTFMNCLDISPCWGWLNTNATIRGEATAHANQLNQVLRDIVSNTTFSNFKMTYYDFPMEAMFSHWKTTTGRPVLELFEPFLGMHTTQGAVASLAEVLWGKLEKDHPEFLGAVNPNNDKIKQIFGDQGGY